MPPNGSDNEAPASKLRFKNADLILGWDTPETMITERQPLTSTQECERIAFFDAPPVDVLFDEFKIAALAAARKRFLQKLSELSQGVQNSPVEADWAVLDLPPAPFLRISQDILDQRMEIGSLTKMSTLVAKTSLARAKSPYNKKRQKPDLKKSHQLVPSRASNLKISIVAVPALPLTDIPSHPLSLEQKSRNEVLNKLRGGDIAGALEEIAMSGPIAFTFEIQRAYSYHIMSNPVLAEEVRLAFPKAITQDYVEFMQRKSKMSIADI